MCSLGGLRGPSAAQRCGCGAVSAPVTVAGGPTRSAKAQQVVAAVEVTQLPWAGSQAGALGHGSRKSGRDPRDWEPFAGRPWSYWPRLPGALLRSRNKGVPGAAAPGWVAALFAVQQQQ